MSSITKICSVEECNKPLWARGWCGTHYARYWRHGNTDKLPYLNPGTHGLTKTPEYAAWRAMKHRCNNPSNEFYHRYGGRGITVCDEWNAKDGFLKFLEDMGKRPSINHSIDRMNNNGNYEPDNCRWAIKEIQVANKNKPSNNTSGYKGVCKIPNYPGWWKARLCIAGRRIDLGKFISPELAAIEYDKAVIFFIGDYGVTNIL